MANSDVTRGRLVLLICKNCRMTFEVSSPDDKHTFAAQTSAAFKIPSPLRDGIPTDNLKEADDEIIEFEHECPKCKNKNKVYWGKPKIP